MTRRNPELPKPPPHERYEVMWASHDAETESWHWVRELLTNDRKFALDRTRDLLPPAIMRRLSDGKIMHRNARASQLGIKTK